MPSAWHVEKVCTGAVQQVETAGRDFGKVLIDQLAETAPLLRGTLAQEEMHDYAAKLLDLSDWCATTKGYGNFLLAQRCLNLACVPLTRLVADLSVPQARYAPLLERLHPYWMQARPRADVLNKEAGMEFFPASATTGKQVYCYWLAGLVVRRERFDPTWPQRRENLPGYQEPECLTSQLRKELATRLDFFADDKFNANLVAATLQNRWNVKWHENLVGEISDDGLAREARALAEFRAVVGSFPTNDNPRAFERGGEGAFYEVWQAKNPQLPSMTVEEWNKRLLISITAWRAYDKVQRGRLLDNDSEAERGFLGDAEWERREKTRASRVQPP